MEERASRELTMKMGVDKPWKLTLTCERLCE
jgi:hypothetical protein